VSIAQDHDDRFDEAEHDVDHGNPWYFREPEAPNPLTIEAREWSTGVTKLGEAEFLNGVDRQGKSWSVLVGSVVLTKKLIEGLVEEWSDDAQAFVVTETLGRVRPGEVVSIKYLGDVEGSRYPYPNQRPPAPPRRDHPSGQCRRSHLRPLSRTDPRRRALAPRPQRHA
jgi:hypothetical protein